MTNIADGVKYSLAVLQWWLMTALCRSVISLILMLSFLSSQTQAQVGNADTEKDTAAYIELLSKIRELPLEEKVQALQNYLSEHPQSSHRDEIEQNIQNLNKLLVQSNPVQKAQKKDAELYLKAVGYSKTLSLEDQIGMWEQFLKENPKTIYKEEVITRLEVLRSRLAPSKKSTQQKKTSEQRDNFEPIALRLKYKDKQKGILLAIGPGLIVPGMGHWYAEEYLVAGILSVLRVAGLAVGIPGIMEQNNNMILTGSLLAGFSYLADIGNVPFAIERYNDRLEAQRLKKSYSERPKGFELQYSWKF